MSTTDQRDKHLPIYSYPSEATHALAAELAAGLRQMATMLTDHPHLAKDLRYGPFNMMRVPVGLGDDDARSQMVTFARDGRAAGATVTEHDTGTWAVVDVTFGPVSLHVYTERWKVHGAIRSVEEVEYEQGADGHWRPVGEVATA